MKNLFVTTLALAGFFAFNVMAQNSLQISPDEIQKSLDFLILLCHTPR